MVGQLGEAEAWVCGREARAGPRPWGVAREGGGRRQGVGGGRPVSVHAGLGDTEVSSGQ